MLEIGDHAPTNELVNDAGESAGFVDYRGSELIVFFYPAAMTPGCTAEACGFRDNFDRFKQAGYDIVGVSPDEPVANAAFREHDALGFRLLSDVDHVVAEQLGAWGMKVNYGREHEGLIRSTFVLDADGVITHAWRNVRAKGHVARVARELLEA
jgi:peroxiredoxin Q/BCP